MWQIPPGANEEVHKRQMEQLKLLFTKMGEAVAKAFSNQTIDAASLKILLDNIGSWCRGEAE